MKARPSVLPSLSRDWSALLGFTALSFLLRSSSFFRTNLDWDEGIYVLMARSMLDGELPYDAVWDHKPPGIFVIYALAQLIFGESMVSIRIAACLAVAATSFVLYRFGDAVGGDRWVGLIAGTLYAVFSANKEGLAANTEVFYVPLIAFGFCLLMKNDPGESSDPAWRPLAVGLLFGLALQIQYVVIFDILAVYLIVGISLLVVDRDRSGDAVRRIVKTCALISLGVVIPQLVVLLFFWTAGNLNQYLHANFTANALYVSTTELTWRGVLSVPRKQVATNAILWIGLAAALFYFAVVVPPKSSDRRVLGSLLVWTAFAFLGVCATRRFYPHYFLHMLPPACLVVAFLVGRVVAASPGTYRRLALVLILGAPVLQAVYPALEHSARLVWQRWIRGSQHWGDESAAIGEYVRQRIGPEEFIYVVDCPPVLYYLASARVPTRYPFPLHLIGPHHSTITGVDPFRELSAILNRRPVYVLRQRRGDSPFFTELERVLGRNYVLETTIGRTEVFRLDRVPDPPN